MRKIILGIVLLFTTNYIHAQSISGKTNTPATIFINELNKVISTDSTGHFNINSIPKGFYTIQISSIGYQTMLTTFSFPFDELKHKKNESILITSQSENIFIDITLQKTQIEIKEVTISGTRNSLQNNSTMSMDVVEMNSMRERGQITVMEALANKPGIALVSTGIGIARPVIRGLTGNRIVTVINGVKLENQQWDIEHTLGLNQYGIDRVEIIKGPASFLYGSDAMGGVLNFIDEKPAPINSIIGDASASFNSNTFSSTTDVGLRGAKEHINWSFRAGLTNHSDYYKGNFTSDDRVANSRFREFLGKATLGLNYKKSVTLFSYQLNMGYYGIVEPFEKKDTTGKVEEDHPMEFETPYHTLIHHTALAKNTLLLGSTKLISTLSYQNDQRKELESGNTENNPSLGFNLNVVSIDVKVDHNFNENVSLILGTQGTFQNNTNEGYSRLIPNYNQLDVSGYALNRYKLINQKLNIDIGARYDHRNINSSINGIKNSADYMPALTNSYENLSASFGLNYLLAKNLYFYGNVGTGYRAPNMAELTSNGIRLETQRYELGNISFTKETNLQGEIGIRADYNDISFEASSFYNHINNFIYTQRRGDTLREMPVYEFKQANAWIFGGEAKIDVHPMAINWLEITSAYSQLEGHLSDATYLPLMPQNKLNNEIILRKNVFAKVKNTFLRTSYVYVFAQNNLAVNEYKTPAYHLVNLSLGGDIKLFKQICMITIGANNLLNELYYDHLSRLRPYGVYNMGINGFVSIKVPFSIKTK